MASDVQKLLSQKPFLIMGVLNATPDSLFSTSRLERYAADEVIARAIALREAGADIIDIGAESSRPGAEYIDLEEERNRLAPLLEPLCKSLDCPVSIDTRKFEIARLALDAGVQIINDISAGEDAQGLFDLVARYRAGIVLMHKQGEPSSMQREPRYDNVVLEVRNYLIDRAEHAESSGVESIIIDPGLGFGKTYEHNIALIQGMQSFSALRWPVLVGHSRKGVLSRLGLDSALSWAANGDVQSALRPVEQRLLPGLGLSCALVDAGVRVLRVHDVYEHVQTVSAFIAARGILGVQGGAAHA